MLSPDLFEGDFDLTPQATPDELKAPQASSGFLLEALDFWNYYWGGASSQDMDRLLKMVWPITDVVPLFSDIADIIEIAETHGLIISFAEVIGMLEGENLAIYSDPNFIEGRYQVGQISALAFDIILSRQKAEL